MRREFRVYCPLACSPIRQFHRFPQNWALRWRFDFSSCYRWCRGSSSDSGPLHARASHWPMIWDSCCRFRGTPHIPPPSYASRTRAIGCAVAARSVSCGQNRSHACSPTVSTGESLGTRTGGQQSRSGTVSETVRESGRETGGETGSESGGRQVGRRGASRCRIRGASQRARQWARQ